jgi:hypothetical protein
MKLLNLMIPDYVLGDFNGIGTPGVTIAARDQQKNPLTRIFNFMRVGKSQLSLKYLQPKFRLVCTAKIALLWFSKKWIIVM